MNTPISAARTAGTVGATRLSPSRLVESLSAWAARWWPLAMVASGLLTWIIATQWAGPGTIRLGLSPQARIALMLAFALVVWRMVASFRVPAEPGSVPAWLRFAGACWLVAVVVNLLLLVVPVVRYGDFGDLGRMVHEGRHFARWLGGTVLLDGLFRLFGRGDMLAAWYLSVFAGLGAMVTASWVLARRAAQDSGAMLVLLSPIWLLLASGYDEYYPLIAGLFVLYLYTVHGDGLRSPWARGVLAAALPLMYVGFAPLAVILVGQLLVEHRHRRAWAAAALALGLYLAIVHCIWPGGFPAYWVQLRNDMSLGERGMIWSAYAGLSRSADSPFFAWSHVWSWPHLAELSRMMFLGAGWFGPLLIGIGVAMTTARWARAYAHLRWPTGRQGVLAVSYGWQLYFFLCMIPKLGPSRDIDLFFCAYLSAAFVAGRLLERQLAACPPAEARNLRRLAHALALGAGIGIVQVLLFHGI